jgi:hypothetical protein
MASFLRSPQKPGGSRLEVAFHNAMEFTASNAASLVLSETQLRGYAGEEASFGRIIVDDQGLTAGTKLHILQPARALLAKWKEARSSFDTAIEPKLADINAVENLQREIEILKTRRAADVAQIDQTWEANQEHRAIRKRWEEADAVYHQSRLNNGMRDARMTAHRPIYMFAMFCIGIAEWLINYDTFFLFVGVPAIAAGATLILGILLAFSAHGHGELFKQWSHRFGQDQTHMNRVGGYRLFSAYQRLDCSSFCPLLADQGMPQRCTHWRRNLPRTFSESKRWSRFPHYGMC